MSHKKKDKGTRNMRCQMSGKLTQNREVVLTSEAVNYVRKMGFIVLPSIFQDLKDLEEANY